MGFEKWLPGRGTKQGRSIFGNRSTEDERLKKLSPLVNQDSELFHQYADMYLEDNFGIDNWQSPSQGYESWRQRP